MCVLWTEDLNDGQVFQGVRIRNPFVAGRLPLRRRVRWCSRVLILRRFPLTRPRGRRRPSRVTDHVARGYSTWRSSECAVVSSMSRDRLSTEQVMTRLSLEIELPDTLAKQAKEAGLLEPEAVERMVREALLARRVESLAQAREVLAAYPLPPMTLEEIQAEIDAYRSEVGRADRP